MDHPLFRFLPNGEGEFSTWKVLKSRPTGPKPDKMDDYNTKTKKKVKKKLHAEKSYAGMRDNGSYILSSLRQQSKEPSKNKMLTSLGIFLVE